MAYTVRIKSIVSDGTTIFTEAEISDGPTTYPLIYPAFAVGTEASEIDSYFQTIANSQPVLNAGIQALSGKVYNQA